LRGNSLGQEPSGIRGSGPDRGPPASSRFSLGGESTGDPLAGGLLTTGGVLAGGDPPPEVPITIVHVVPPDPKDLSKDVAPWGTFPSRFAAETASETALLLAASTGSRSSAASGAAGREWCHHYYLGRKDSNKKAPQHLGSQPEMRRSDESRNTWSSTSVRDHWLFAARAAWVLVGGWCA
jgi:hypothetical protein